MAAKDEEYRPVTAQEAAAPYLDNLSGDDQKPVAEDYEAALDAYAARADVETLDARRAREAGVKFEDASFVRDAQREGEGGDPGYGVVSEPDVTPGVPQDAGPGETAEAADKAAKDAKKSDNK